LFSVQESRLALNFKSEWLLIFMERVVAMSTKSFLFAAMFFQAGIAFAKFNDYFAGMSQARELYLALAGLGMCVVSYLFYSVSERRLTN